VAAIENIVMASYTGSRKVLLLAIGFTLILLKGVFLSVGLFVLPDWERLFVPSLVLDLAVLLVFYFGVIRQAP
jgi:hypothetical protein